MSGTQDLTAHVSSDGQSVTTAPAGDSITVSSSVSPTGFTLPAVQFVGANTASSLTPPQPQPVTSSLSAKPAVTMAELLEISGGTGQMLYYPVEVDVSIGDVFYLRERDCGENGIVIQIIKLESATYSQVSSRIIWKLLTAVRANELHRSYHEPAEVIDLFLAATFKVRAAVVDGQWDSSTAGRVVTRNVDIFRLNPQIVLGNILRGFPAVNIHLGDFKEEPVTASGQGFDKVNLITGMKGGGKSHIAKGIIAESQQRGMTTVVFDINGEYHNLPGAQVFRPGQNLKFRLDRVEPRSFVDAVDRIHPFAERTKYVAIAGIAKVFDQRKAAGKPFGIQFLLDQADMIFSGTAEFLKAMMGSYTQSLETVDSYGLFATQEEATQEDQAIKDGQTAPVASLSSVFFNLVQSGQAGVVVIDIGGLLKTTQTTVIRLVRDALKEICDRQTHLVSKDPAHVPVYPTVVFEEAHMYMDQNDINELIPLIRHLGMNLFFVTNTPAELPDSVLRLLDNLIMTRMLNDSDIACVGKCGLADRETIESFAPQLPEHHALVLSAKDGYTSNFPLVFHVRDFGLPPSGRTRSMWHSLSQSASPPSPTDPDSSPSTDAVYSATGESEQSDEADQTK